MAQLGQQARTTSSFVIYGAAALTVALVLGLAMAFGPLRIPSIPTQSDGHEISPALVEAGRDWQRQRELQGGFTDPLGEAGREWQRQREQQAPGR